MKSACYCFLYSQVKAALRAARSAPLRSGGSSLRSTAHGTPQTATDREQPKGRYYAGIGPDSGRRPGHRERPTPRTRAPHNHARTDTKESRENTTATPTHTHGTRQRGPLLITGRRPSLGPAPPRCTHFFFFGAGAGGIPPTEKPPRKRHSRREPRTIPGNPTDGTHRRGRVQTRRTGAEHTRERRAPGPNHPTPPTGIFLVQSKEKPK